MTTVAEQPVSGVCVNRLYGAALITIALGSGCKTETQLMGCGAVGVAGVGGVASWAMAESTAYDPNLRDSDGLLVPIAQQNDKNLVPVAVAIGGVTVLVSGLLVVAAINETLVDAEREAKRAEPPPGPAPVGDAPPSM